MVSERMAQRVVVCVTLIAATASSQAQTPQSGAKPLAFEVVSIRQNASTPRPGMPVMGPIGDGYRMINTGLLMPFLTAYVPSTGGNSFFRPDQISGMPEWPTGERYDLTAKVADADLVRWQQPAAQPAMLREMLQAMFADRCKLVVHRETKQVAVQFLVVGKSGPKLKETDPTVVHEGTPVPWGGVMAPAQEGMMLYGISAGTLATLLSEMLGTSEMVVDKTGLTGRYDVLLPMRERMPRDADPTSAALSTLENLGLKLESGKAPVETLVIDHIERPSAN